MQNALSPFFLPGIEGPRLTAIQEGSYLLVGNYKMMTMSCDDQVQLVPVLGLGIPPGHFVLDFV